MNEASILKDELNKNKLEVQKSNTIATGKKIKLCQSIEDRRNDSPSVTSEGKRPKHPDEMSSQVHISELGGGRSESTKVSWSQKSSWRELLGNGGSSPFNASHMLVDCNASGKERTDGFCEPASAKNKTEHIVMEGGQKIEPANAEIYCLKQQVAVMQLLVDPMSRWQTFGAQASEAIAKAKEIDPSNPRPYLLEGQYLMNVPEAFGGGKAVAKKLFENNEIDKSRYIKKVEPYLSFHVKIVN